VLLACGARWCKCLAVRRRDFDDVDAGLCDQQRGVWSLKDRAKSDDAAVSETIAMEAEASEVTITDLCMPKSTDVINHGRSTVGPGGRCMS
jgi:hypothetical protein